MGVKQRSFTYQTEFALISTNVIVCAYNFTQSTTIAQDMFPYFINQRSAMLRKKSFYMSN
jgi:hypothetical protein